jgi:hypothetical protein
MAGEWRLVVQKERALRASDAARLIPLEVVTNFYTKNIVKPLGLLIMKVILLLLSYYLLKVVPVLIQEPCHEDVWGSGVIVPRILNHGTRWRLVVNFTPRPLYSRGRSG